MAGKPGSGRAAESRMPAPAIVKPFCLSCAIKAVRACVASWVELFWHLRISASAASRLSGSAA